MSDSLASAPVTKVERNSLKMGKIPFIDRVYIYMHFSWQIISRDKLVTYLFSRKKVNFKITTKSFPIVFLSYQSEFVRVEFIIKKRKKYLERSRQTNWQNKLVHIRSIDSYLNLSFSSKHSIVIVSIIVQRLWAHG